MTQEEKELLFKDLCARLPYGVKVLDNYHKSYGVSKIINIGVDGSILVYNEVNDIQYYPIIDDIKPYLRPMSSITEEEKKIQEDYYIYHFSGNNLPNYEDDFIFEDEVHEYIDWLNTYHLDYRGLIEKGLALEAPEGMYN